MDTTKNGENDTGAGGPETTGGRRTTRVSGPPADAEVSDRPKRRRFTARDKVRILALLDDCSQPGEIGAVLRREGVYSSTITRWRRQRDAGAFQGLSAAKRGPKMTPPNPLAKDVARLEREKANLERRLLQAETIIDVQKKVSQLLEIPLSGTDSDGKS